MGIAQQVKVVGIKDGDTFVVLDKDYRELTIRLANIDCPEMGRPYSDRAKKFVAKEIFGAIVELKVLKLDRYGRTIASVGYDGKDLAMELLKKGLAWHYSYFSHDLVLQGLEDIARKNGIGLWAEPDPIEPYRWRKYKKLEKKGYGSYH